MDKNQYQILPTTSLTPQTPDILQSFVFVGTHGKIRAFEIVPGGMREVWGEELKGCGYRMVHILLKPIKGHLYAATYGNLFCFDALTGQTVWKTKPESQNGFFTSDLMTLLCSYDESMLISASNGRIVALNANTGQILWETSIPRLTGRRDVYVVVEHKEFLFVADHGHVYCYFKDTGVLCWENKLSGYGYSPVSLAACSFVMNEGKTIDEVVYVGTSGYLLALDGHTGVTRETVNFKRTGYHPVTMLLDPSLNMLYAGTSGELRCFRADTLVEIWKSDLTGMSYSFGQSLLHLDHQTLGIGMNGYVAAIDKMTGNTLWKTRIANNFFVAYGFVTLAASPNPNLIFCGYSGKLFVMDKQGNRISKDGLKGMGYSELTISTSVFNTDFNSTTLPHYIEMERRQRHNTAAANS